MSKAKMNNFHDAILQNIVFSFEQSLVSMSVLAYPNSQSKERRIYRLLFSNVTLFSTTIDVRELERNEFAGTVVAIREHERDKVTKIYLTGGAILIGSAPMEFEERNNEEATDSLIIRHKSKEVAVVSSSTASDGGTS